MCIYARILAEYVIPQSKALKLINEFENEIDNNNNLYSL